MKQQIAVKPRDGFTTSLGVIAATLGSAIGLGNIWKFPSLTGTNGGAAFLVLYLACTLLVGLPVMISGLALGRWARSEAVATLSNDGMLHNRRMVRLTLGVVKFVTPVLVFVVLLSGLGVIKL